MPAEPRSSGGRASPASVAARRAFDHRVEATFGPRRSVLVDQVLGSSSVQFLRCQAKLFASPIQLARLNRFSNATQLCPHVTAAGTVDGASSFVLSESLDGAGSIRHFAGDVCWTLRSGMCRIEVAPIDERIGKRAADYDIVGGGCPGHQETSIIPVGPGSKRKRTTV